MDGPGGTSVWRCGSMTGTVGDAGSRDGEFGVRPRESRIVTGGGYRVKRGRAGGVGCHIMN